MWREVADAPWTKPGLKVYCCCCSGPDLDRFVSAFVSVLSPLSPFCLGFVSVLSRFCLGLVSPLLPQTPYHPTGGVIGILFFLLKIEAKQQLILGAPVSLEDVLSSWRVVFVVVADHPRAPKAPQR